MPAYDSKTSKRGLGRGFSSLIPTDLLDESFDPTASQDQKVSDLRQIKIDQITPDVNQPRRRFDEFELQELAASIREHGVLQPIIVTPKDGKYQIVAGERRYRACKIVGLEKIPALVRTLNDQNKLEVSLIENLQRADLNSMETATAYLKLRDQFNLTLEEIGQRVGNRSKSTISNTLRLLKLPQSARQAIVEGNLTEGQSRPLIGLEDDIVDKILPRIIKEQWTSRRVEQFVTDLRKNRANTVVSTMKEIEKSPYEKQLHQIQRHLGADVRIDTNSKGAGKITIKFQNEDEFERLKSLLS